jgi:diaminopropionate ammonia-lyase
MAMLEVSSLRLIVGLQYCKLTCSRYEYCIHNGMSLGVSALAQRIVLNRQPGGPVSVRQAQDCVRAFHASMPGYLPTPCISLPDVAAQLGIKRLMVKNEQQRLGLPAYKILGSAWALHEAIRRGAKIADGVVLPFSELQSRARHLGAVTLTTATDGNHGCGVALMARQLGFQCVVFVAHDMKPQRRRAIAAHGAQVEVVPGGYDDAVQASASAAAQNGWWSCADTTLDTGDLAAAAFASDVQQGYETLCFELVSQLGEFPGVMLVQAGVGALAASVLNFMAAQNAPTRVLTVEPLESACVFASIEQQTPTVVADLPTRMAGLRAKQVSAVAWPTLQGRLYGALRITDSEAARAVRVLAAAGIEAGDSGAAGLAGALLLSRVPSIAAALEIDAQATVAVINTEGATDPESYAMAMADKDSEP